MHEYKTIYEIGSAEIEVKKSKFIGYAKPISSEEEAQEFIAKIRKKHWDASHNVPAYLLGLQNEIQKCSDDGEPGGSSGMPILELLKREDLHDVIVVVTRYYGGIKLGVGGLVRAYTQAAKEALEAAKIVSRQNLMKLHVIMGYSQNDKVSHMLEKEQIVVMERNYGQDVEVTLLLEQQKVESVQDKLKEICNGHIYMESMGSDFYTIYEGAVLY